MKHGVLIFFLVLSGFAGTAQALRTRNIIFVTLDGFRWQELFQGADSTILFNKRFVKDKSTAGQFWHSSAAVRREKLMPFVWNVIGSQGQLYGNRAYGNLVDCSNPFKFSCPGYSEMLVGFVDRRVDSNSSVSPNPTVLEFISCQQEYQDRVAVFSSWEGISLITRPKESSIEISAGRAMASGEISEREKLLNELQQVMSKRGPRHDALTFQYAFEYLKRARPRVMYISFDETDSYGHKGKYDDYLTAAHQNDAMIHKLWDWVQSQEDYRDQTTLVITTDHGRGEGARHGWKRHGAMTSGSGQVWMLALGPDTPAYGEMKMKAHYFQKQVAGTLAAFLGLDYTNREQVGEVIHNMIRSEMLSDNISSRQDVSNTHK
jgi:hypothetical protein